MSYILNISTAVPEFEIGKEDLPRFYLQTFNADDTNHLTKKINYLAHKTKINTRYTCIPDYKGNEHELYINGDFKPSIEKRMELYKNNVPGAPNVFGVVRFSICGVKIFISRMEKETPSGREPN